MPVDHIRYDLLTQDALRGLIHKVLADAAAKGLPGEHHFFITFDTRVEGVRISSRLKAKYPEEMTIVLQHQFWDLTVGEEDFDIGLSFNGIPERLHVPLKAVKSFVDPSVQFGLQFATEAESDTGEAGSAAAAPAPAALARPTPVASPSKKTVLPEGEVKPGVPTVASPSDKADTATVPSKDEGTGEVVRFDRFRKK